MALVAMTNLPFWMKATSLLLNAMRATLANANTAKPDTESIILFLTAISSLGKSIWVELE
jgi:hypothetical protein